MIDHEGIFVNPQGEIGGDHVVICSTRIKYGFGTLCRATSSSVEVVDQIIELGFRDKPQSKIKDCPSVVFWNQKDENSIRLAQSILNTHNIPSVQLIFATDESIQDLIDLLKSLKTPSYFQQFVDSVCRFFGGRREA